MFAILRSLSKGIVKLWKGSGKGKNLRLFQRPDLHHEIVRRTGKFPTSWGDRITETD